MVLDLHSYDFGGHFGYRNLLCFFDRAPRASDMHYRSSTEVIRSATEEDFAEILEMSALFWLDTQFSEPFEADHTRNMVQMAYDFGLLAVVEIDGKCVGFCAAVKSPILGSTKAWCATELAWFVYPEHRKGKNGIALLLFMEKLVQEQGIKYWTMVSMQSSMPEEVGRMYERMGYVHSETCYTKVFHYGSGDNSSGGISRGGGIRC